MALGTWFPSTFSFVAAMSCSFKCFDVELVKAWAGTLQEYWSGVINPFGTCSPSDMITFKGSGVDSFQAWSYVWFWAQVFVVISTAAGNYFYFQLFMVSSVVQGLLMAFFNASIQWFGVCKRFGCCWCICCCLEGPLLLAIFGIVNMVSGALNALAVVRLLPGMRTIVPDAIPQTVGYFDVSNAPGYYLVLIFLFILAVAQFYMGANSFKIHQEVAKGQTRDLESSENEEETEEASEEE